MKLFLSTLAATGLTFAVLALSSSAVAADTNLVTNPGFETGDFTGYTVLAGATGVATFITSPGPNSGSYFASLGNVGGDGTISQDIATTPGQQYEVSFFLASDGGTPNHFAAFFDGNSLFDQVDIPLQGYIQYSFLATASTATTTLQFNERNDPSFLALDDISVTAVTATPEPGSIALLVTGGLSGAAFLKRRKRTAR